MCIHKLGRAGSFFSDHACDARQRDLELFRIGSEWKKKSSLRDARLHGLGGERNL